MSLAERYSDALRGLWTADLRRQMKQAAEAYKQCVKNAWAKGTVSKQELQQCAVQAGIVQRYHAIMTGG